MIREQFSITAAVTLRSVIKVFVIVYLQILEMYQVF